MEILKITTDKQPEWYKVDWDRIDFNGVIRILRALDPRFADNHNQFNNIEDLLIKEEPQAFYFNTTNGDK